jgi:hypothetical protein
VSWISSRKEAPIWELTVASRMDYIITFPLPAAIISCE